MYALERQTALAAHAKLTQFHARVGLNPRVWASERQAASHRKQGCGCGRQQRRQQQSMTCAVTSDNAQGATYEWSWNTCRSSLPEFTSTFDTQHPIKEDLSLQEWLRLVSVAAASEQLPSQHWMQQLMIRLQPHLQQLQSADISQLLQHLAQLDYTPDEQSMSALLHHACIQRHQLSTQQLSVLLWSLSNLRHTLQQQHWESILQAAESKLQDFYGPDLAQFLCAAGSIYSSSNSSYDAEVGLQAMPVAAAQTQLTLPPCWSTAVAKEVEYQVVEFVGDLCAFDLARLASGLADLSIEPSQKLQDALLKAVYMRTRTIEEKGAVDFALAKLDAKGKKSMHYDPRWTHEELKWLPRRERDKRRIIKETWYRTQWGGFAPGKEK